MKGEVRIPGRFRDSNQVLLKNGLDLAAVDYVAGLEGLGDVRTLGGLDQKFPAWVLESKILPSLSLATITS